MAKTRRVIEIPEVKATRVRYGRATLTIARCGGFFSEDLSQAIAAFERDELTALELCGAFVRARVRRHSPSFNWDESDPTRLLALVTEISDDPVFETVEPEFIAEALVEAHEREGQQLRESLRRMRRQIAEQAAVPSETIRAASFQSNLMKLFKPIETFKAGGPASLVGQEWVRNHRSLAGVVSQIAAGHFDHIGAAGRAVTQIDGLAPPRLSKQIADLVGIGARGQKIQSLVGAAAFETSALKSLGADLASRKQHLLGVSGLIEAAGFKLDAHRPNYVINTPGFESLAGQMFRGSKLTFGLETSPLIRDLQRIGGKFGDWIDDAKGFLPVNWRELESSELSQVVEVMKTEGLCLAWAPREEIVRELAAADTSLERSRILVERQSEIVDDIEKALADVESEHLLPYVEAGDEAIAAAKAGYFKPALSHVAMTITAVVHGPLGFENFKPVRQKFADTDPLHEVGFRVFPLYAVGRTLVYALDHMKNAGDGFNRNLTLHRLGGHYNEANLVMGLLLLAGLLREVDRLLGVPRQRQVTATTST